MLKVLFFEFFDLRKLMNIYFNDLNSENIMLHMNFICINIQEYGFINAKYIFYKKIKIIFIFQMRKNLI